MPDHQNPITPPADERPKSHRKTWIVLGVIGIVGLVLAGTMALVLSRLVMPAIGPHLAVASAVQKEFPGSNPNAGVAWTKGGKTFRITVAAGFNPMSDSTRATAMANRIAEIVRERFDLTGYSGITVNVQQRRSAGVVHVSSGRSFQFPAQAGATADKKDAAD